MAIDLDREVCLTATRNIEYSVAGTLAEVAKIMGVSPSRLVKIVDEGEDYELSDAAIGRIQRQGDVESDEFEVDGIEG